MVGEGIRTKLRAVFDDSRVVSFIRSDTTKIFGVLGSVIVLMTLAAAGILSGAGLFLLAMLSADGIAVIGSSLLLSISLATFLAGYIWLTR
jgi:hypothetical protein